MQKMTKKPTAKQRAKVVEAVLLGKTTKEAAELAGVKLAVPTLQRKIQDELQQAREEVRRDLGVTREDVIEGFKAAILHAQIVDDPASEIRGWSEIAKVAGLYAPEVKKIDVSHSLATMRKDLENLPDEELLRLADGGRLLTENDGASITDEAGNPL